MFCFEPLVLTGYLFMMLPHRTNGANLNAPMVEVISCDHGLGLNLKASQSGVYAASAQYGFQWSLGEDWRFTVAPNLGVGYHDVMVLEEQSKLTFSLGGRISLSYKRADLGVEWWHNSNAGLGDRNAGLDMIGVTGGWKF